MSLNERGIEDMDMIIDNYDKFKNTKTHDSKRAKLKSKKKLKKKLKKTKSDNNFMDNLYKIGIEGALASLLFFVFNLPAFTNMYGDYLPKFWTDDDDVKCISMRGKLYQSVAIVILFVIIKIWIDSMMKNID